MRPQEIARKTPFETYVDTMIASVQTLSTSNMPTVIGEARSNLWVAAAQIVNEIRQGTNADIVDSKLALLDREHGRRSPVAQTIRTVLVIQANKKTA